MFVKTWIAADKYLVQDCENVRLAIQIQLSEKRKGFSEFSVPFLESTPNFKYFEKRMIVIANVFRKLEAVKILFRPLSKKCRFRTRFNSQHVKASQILAKSPWERFCHSFPSFSRNLIWKTSPLTLGEISADFVNTLTADGMFPVQDCENLQVPIQMQLLSKTETFFSISSSISRICIRF